MDIKEKAVSIMKSKFVCNNCLGRNFASLLTGMTNEQRGEIIRRYVAFSVDSGEKLDIDESNFSGIKFRNVKIKNKEPTKCYLCGNLFKTLKKKVKLIIEELQKYEFKTFLVGTNPPSDVLETEQELWNKIGIEWTESIRTEINRELGKEISAVMNKEMDRKNPDITVLYDFEKNKVRLQVRSLFIFGKYQKLVRGIPQTKWKRKVHKTSVQEIVAKPLLEYSQAEDSSFHGEGREDVDVLCLGYRPFVIELLNPIKRSLDLKKIEKLINKSSKAKVTGLKYTNRNMVRDLKTVKHDKTYLAVVTLENKVKNLSKLKELKNAVISQNTPTRVIRRRSDKLRRRLVKDIKFKKLGSNRIQLKITSQSGLYIKELITGDDGRTAPNVADLLGNKVKKIELDVVKIHEK